MLDLSLLKSLENTNKIINELILLNNKLDLLQDILNDLHDINQKLKKESE